MSDRFEFIDVPRDEPKPKISLPKISLPEINLRAIAPWIAVACLVVFIIWDRREPGPDAGIDVRKPVARFHEQLCENLASAQEALADFCEGRNPDATEIIGESKKLVEEALRASGKALAETDNKYLRDGTPSERAEYLRSIAKELRGYK